MQTYVDIMIYEGGANSAVCIQLNQSTPWATKTTMQITPGRSLAFGHETRVHASIAATVESPAAHYTRTPTSDAVVSCSDNFDFYFVVCSRPTLYRPSYGLQLTDAI